MPVRPAAIVAAAGSGLRRGLAIAYHRGDGRQRGRAPATDKQTAPPGSFLKPYGGAVASGTLTWGTGAGETEAAEALASLDTGSTLRIGCHAVGRVTISNTFTTYRREGIGGTQPPPLRLRLGGGLRAGRRRAGDCEVVLV